MVEERGAVQVAGGRFRASPAASSRGSTFTLSQQRALRVTYGRIQLSTTCTSWFELGALRGGCSLVESAHPIIQVSMYSLATNLDTSEYNVSECS